MSMAGADTALEKIWKGRSAEAMGQSFAWQKWPLSELKRFPFDWNRETALALLRLTRFLRRTGKPLRRKTL
jgi:hypothetical protein